MPSNTTAPPAKKKGRRARLIVLVLVLALVAGAGYGGYWGVSTVRGSFPQTTGDIRLDSLSGEVEVKRDAYGIPQIYADTEADLFRAQGYVQAQDRFYEMDVRRHMTAGRLSEMFGKSQVDTDAFLRTLGWRQVAQQEYDKVLSADTKKNLQAYAEGVNAYLKGRDASDVSVEYAALAFTNDYEIEPWSPVDSVAWLKAMAWDLRGNMQDEIDRSLMTSRLSPAQIKQLYPGYPTDLHQPIMQNGAVDKGAGKFDPKATASKHDDGDGSGSGDALRGAQTQLGALSNTLDEIPALLGPNGNGIGSNSWVVSGKYTTSGKPLLANDPHLAPMLPSLWYQMGLHCRSVSATCRYDVSGYTFSGTPGVIIGHNDTVAWGLTNLGADVTDLYLEKVSDEGYVVDGKVKPFRTREETIKVAGGGDRKITVRSTEHGPLVSDRSSELEKVGQKAPVGNAAPDRGTGYAVSLQWTALQPGRSMDAIFELNRAKNFKQFRAAAKNFEVPSQNLIYADAENIGYQAPGRIPERAKGDGTVPAPGWDSSYKWKGYIPYDELPYELNPSRGYIVTANQAVVDRDKYPYLLTEDWGYGSRSQRINDLVESKIKDGGKVSPDDMRTMQMDNRSEIATLLNPLLLKIDISDPYVREAQKLLEGWDYTQEPDSAAAAYFNAVWRNVLKLAFGDKLPKELRAEGDCISVRPADLTGLPVDEQNKRVRECGERDADTAQPDGGDRWYEVVRPLLKQENSEWWKTEANRTDQATETRDQLLARAMEDARWELTAKLGKDVSTWSWGRLHQLTLQNQTLGTAGPGFVQSLLNRGPWNLGGGEAAVNATGWNAAGGYEVIWVPSMRMVVNVGDWDRSRWINLSGASGHAYHDNYTDQTDKWVKGELLDWSFGKAAVDASTKDTLVLKP
ncbi:penicillin acylase family protein [Streptomyces sp. P9(2023)]|uniref:penicillin acylase family protein n=1 Tax=Streptomyces sp. P9(2023) TaxID=3064394 RepID=UPI0028F42D23|nr:penicillin acylase family protein [Streptomyces sp. P9(2023)]MDT9692473.1 penicillin acylase family protein [Streptomyces sp. P9(2023)]